MVEIVTMDGIAFAATSETVRSPLEEEDDDVLLSPESEAFVRVAVCVAADAEVEEEVVFNAEAPAFTP